MSKIKWLKTICLNGVSPNEKGNEAKRKQLVNLEKWHIEIFCTIIVTDV